LLQGSSSSGAFAIVARPSSSVCSGKGVREEGSMNWRPRKIAAATIGWPSAGLLGLSVGGMFLAPDIAVWPLGASLIGIAIAVIISSKTLRQKIADTVRRR
jgi:hypothetical protein